MNARLVAVSGPLRGSVFAIADGELSIGRQETNGVAVPDRAVSRRHGLIRRVGDRFTLHDLDSRNGCFVNSVPVKERELENGDRIGIGESQFVFRTADAESGQPAQASVQLDDEEELQGLTVRLRREDAIYLSDDARPAASQAAARKVSDLQTLLHVSQVISSGGSPPALAARLLELVMEVVPADRGAVLLDSGSGEFDVAVGRERKGSGAAPVHVGQTLVRRVLREREALLCNDIPHDEVLSKAQSIASALVHAVLVAPILSNGGPIGVVYLAILSPARQFDQMALQLVTGIAGIAAGALDNALRLERLESEKRLLQTELEVGHRMIGVSEPMARVYQFIARAAREPSTVLILGESGTGKELVAHALHANSPRASKPFVAVNCAALPDELLESELFGHEKGSFTGADAATVGKIQAAHGGTLFLDEIAEMSNKLQAKLLRVIEQREVDPLGGTRPRRVDIRVIAATHRNLEEEIQKKNFRQDLYFRLNVVSVRMPALRDRREDILPLAEHFLVKHCRQSKRRLKSISQEARDRLVHYDWPGNVRELSNAIERAVVLGSGDEIRPEDLPEALAEMGSLEAPRGAFHDAVLHAKKDIIQKTLARTGGNVSEAARLLGIHVNYLHRVIRTLGVKTPDRASSKPPEPGKR